MDEASFRAALKADGFDEVLDRHMPAAAIGEDHTHDFDARIYVQEGEFILRRPDGTRHFARGESVEVPAGTPHGEGFGPSGAAYLAGRRHRR